MGTTIEKPRVQRVPASAGAEEILKAYHQDGGVIIEGFLSSSQVSQINCEVDACIGKISAGTTNGSKARMEFHGSNTKRMTNLVTHSATFRMEILENPLIHELTQKTLSKNADKPTYWLNTTQLIEIGPGNKAQALHRDCYYPLVPRNKDAPEIVNNCLIALTDYKEEYGATRVIPGSHLWDDFDDTGTPERTVPAEMNPGDALLICGSVVHGGGANVSKDFYRRALSFSFCLNCMTPEEAVPLLVPKEIARTMGKLGQQMCGFRSQPLMVGPGNWLANFEELALELGMDN